MKRYLITGFSGFVSYYILQHLNNENSGVKVMGLDVNIPSFNFSDFPQIDIRFETIDLLNDNLLEDIIVNFKPDYVIHLASYSSVAFSWKNPAISFSNNTKIFLNLIEQIRKLDSPCRVLSIGSSEEYGRGDPQLVPLSEDHPLNPVSPYAVARVSQEMLSKIYVTGFNADIVLTRSFNHIGARQRDIFVIPSK